MQQSTETNQARPRSTRRQMPNMNLGTAAAAGVVLVLLAVTFVADWMRIPELTLLTTSGTLSPNGDNDFDTLTLSYRLDDEADVTARVLSAEGGSWTMLPETAQTGGQHSVTWAGLNELGQPVTDGNYQIEIIASGAVRSTSAIANLTVDTTAPPLEIINIPNGMRVGENNITVEGQTESGATLLISGSAQPVFVDNGGRFSFTHLLTDGTNNLVLQAIDNVGNVTSVTRDVTLVTVPPEVVIASPLTDSWTNQSVTNVSGVVNTAATITVNNQPVPVAADGSFNYQLLMTEGDNLIQVAATDDVGNVTLEDVLVHVKTTPPIVTLNVGEGQTFGEDVLTLSGTTDPGSIVQINGQSIPTSEAGNFAITLGLLEGANIINIVARDRAGNTTSLARQVTYQPGSAPSGLARLFRNLSVLPTVAIPALLLGGSLFAFFMFRQRGLSIALSTEQQVFRPGLPGEGKYLYIFLDIDQDARVTLEVLDEQGYPRATILKDRRRSARRHTLSWRGYDDYGQPLAPGVYTIQAEAGLNPVKVSSSIQIRIEQDYLAHRGQEQQRVGIRE